MRVASGITCFSNSSRLTVSSVFWNAIPVMFPPGRARLCTSPSATGSEITAMTTGSVLVACLIARPACGPAATMTSGFNSISSFTSAGSRSSFPSAYRDTIAMFAALDIAQLLSPCRSAPTAARRGFGPVQEGADHWDLPRLLRLGGERRDERTGQRGQQEAAAVHLLDHLIRPRQQRRRDREAEGLGGLEVDHEVELGRLLDG